MNVLTNQISQEHIGNQRTSENLPESDIMDQTQRDYSDQGACLVEQNTGVSKISQGATMEKTSNNAKLDRKRKNSIEQQPDRKRFTSTSVTAKIPNKR